ncbi:MAG: WG repeat-containing protein [Bacteroidales bacterium]|nr:WG repeat-containing protein [Bacteroidales bacterium]
MSNQKIKLILLISVLTICATAFGQTKTDIQSIARTLAAQVPEINEKYDRTYSDERHYLYRSAENAEYGHKELQMYWYEQPTAANDRVMVSYNYPPEPWLKCFTFDRKTGALKATDLPFTIPSAYEFDREEFEKDHTYWRFDYTICENGDVVISASPSMNAICITLAHWDKKGSFSLYKRGIDISYGEPVEDDPAAEKYVQNDLRPNFQRINAINNWAWIDKKEVLDLSIGGAMLTYYYSEKELEKIVASLANETVEYYFLDRYLSFIYSKSNAGKERRWYVKKGSCFRGLGDNGKKLSPDEREEEYGEVYSLFSKIIRQSKTTVGATLAVAQNQITEETITKDILSLPEMQFPNAAVMIVETPTVAEPYYTVKGGSNMDSHFATSFWFHVYTEPEYEIRFYDIALDSEMTLSAWRSSKPMYDEVWEDEEVSAFHENLVFAKSNGKVGVINKATKEVVVPLIYDKLDYYFPVHDNWLRVEKDGKWGCVDFNGNTVLSLKYDNLHFNVEENWGFCLNGKWGLVEPNDKIVIRAEYDAILEFNNGLAPVKRNGKWGFINRENELVVPFKYDSVSMDLFGTMYGEVAFVERDGKRFWIDSDGKENPHTN